MFTYANPFRPREATPALNLHDLAAQAVMALTLEEINDVVRAAVATHGENVFDLLVAVPGDDAVIPFGALLVRCAEAVTADV